MDSGKRRRVGALLSGLERILENHAGRTVFVCPALTDWNVPLFQRPQQIARSLAGEGAIYLFGTVNHFDRVERVMEAAPSCFLLDMKDQETEDAVLSFLQKKPNRIIVHLYSGDPTRDYRFVDGCLGKSFDVLYEYIDELAAEISGVPVPRRILERHHRILENPAIYVAATADSLFKEVLGKRPRTRTALVTNGADYGHFSRKETTGPLPDFKLIVQKNKPVIGYFGALASWFDYGLMKQTASTYNQCQIALIGVEYGDCLRKSGLLDYPNVHYLGPVPYERLPSYAHAFDVSVIPFVINNITVSASPVKLFEYMAAGRPVVTTALPECMKYEGVLAAGNNTDFIKKIKLALGLRENKQLEAILKSEAEKNDWKQKAKEILHLLGQE